MPEVARGMIGRMGFKIETEAFMTRVTVDPELRKKLLELREPLYLCDESGLVVGESTPIDTRLC